MNFEGRREYNAHPQPKFAHFVGQECGDSLQRPELLLPVREHGCNTRNRREHGAELPPVRPGSPSNRARHHPQNPRLLLVSTEVRRARG